MVFGALTFVLAFGGGFFSFNCMNDGLDSGPKIKGIGPIGRWPNFPTHVIQIKHLAENERRRRHTQRASPSLEATIAHI
jgi:hypothetical protein